MHFRHFMIYGFNNFLVKQFFFGVWGSWFRVSSLSVSKVSVFTVSKEFRMVFENMELS
jgi:hypothetical protein